MTKNKMFNFDKIITVTEERDLLLLLISQLFVICKQHLFDFMAAQDDKDIISLADFTCTYNLHTYFDFFLEKYKAKYDNVPSKKLVEEMKADWLKHYNEIVFPEYKKEFEIRKKDLGMTPADDIGDMYS